MIPEQFRLSGYHFDLPEERIAQAPASLRDASRLMVLDRQTGAAQTALFSDILRYLPKDCLLVANNSRVVPARLTGRRSSGGKVEFLLLTPPPLLETRELSPGRFRARAEGLLRSSKKVGQGERVDLAPGLSLVLDERGPFGRCMVTLDWTGFLAEILQAHGQLPLPPYIRREAGPTRPEDADRYQTCYADAAKAGSVAAPTAGLHFTPGLKEALTASGREWAEVTLYVGYGTFSPVRSEDIREHKMHAEYVEISPQTAEAVNRAKKQGRPVVAVGTTAARTLEGVWQDQGKIAACAGWTDIFIYPGGPAAFNVIDGLITNFHLPASSLLMLVSAFAGRDRVLAAYRQALQEGFRFFSYGDAMLIF